MCKYLTIDAFSRGPVAQAIRRGARNLAKEKSYNIFLTPIRGFGSLLSGASQFAVGKGFQWFKCREDWEDQANAHFARANTAFRKGVQEFIPTATVLLGTYCVLNWDLEG